MLVWEVDDESIVRVVVVNDHDLFRSALVALLDSEPDIEVVGEARDRPSAISEVRRNLPDVVLLEFPVHPYGEPLPANPDAEWPRDWWVAKFTSPARRVVSLAHESARQLNHAYIGIEHILLGLIRENEGVAAMALRSLGISFSKLRAQIERNGTGDASPSPDRISFTAEVRELFERSLYEAQQLGQDHIDTEHILLGLVHEEGSAAHVLDELGADSGRVRRQVIELLSGVPRGIEGRAWGVNLVREIKEAIPGVGIVALLSRSRSSAPPRRDLHLAAMALRAGASVYEFGPDASERTADAVRVAALLNKL